MATREHRQAPVRAPLLGGSAPDAPATAEVSVVVTARNAAQHLPLLVAALARQTLARERFEVIVVDDDSRDATAEIASAAPFVRLIRCVEHVGLPQGRNLGIAAAVAPIVAFTDADCIPDDDWLERGVARLNETGADILAGGVSIPVGARPTVATLVDSSTYLDQERYTARGFGAGANLWVRRSVFERFGLFSPRLHSYGGDEEEFCQRATGAGATLVYAPEAHVVHPPRVRLREVARKAYRLGYGLSAHRRHNSGPLGRQRRLFLQPRLYLPRRRIYRLERLRGTYTPSKRQLVAMYLSQHLFVQIPAMFGDLRGELHQLRVGLTRGAARVPGADDACPEPDTEPPTAAAGPPPQAPPGYFIKPGYVEREAPVYWDDGNDEVVWQPDVYREASDLARQLGAVRLVDVGCGDASKLVPLRDELELVGIDYGPNIAKCRDRYPFGIWIEADLSAEGLLDLNGAAEGSVVVCADVVEHVVRPEHLLRKLRGLLDAGALALILTTPDRDLVRGADHNGPSPNPAHVREWNRAELARLLRAEQLAGHVGLTRRNDASPFLHTIFAAVPGPAIGDDDAFERWWRYRSAWEDVALEHERLYAALDASGWVRVGRRGRRVLRRLVHR